jgi:hypothetical protein
VRPQLLQIPVALPVSGPAHRHRAHSEMNAELDPISSTGEIRGSRSSKHLKKVHSSVVVVVQLDCSTCSITWL